MLPQPSYNLPPGGLGGVCWPSHPSYYREEGKVSLSVLTSQPLLGAQSCWDRALRPVPSQPCSVVGSWEISQLLTLQENFEWFSTIPRHGWQEDKCDNSIRCFHPRTQFRLLFQIYLICGWIILPHWVSLSNLDSKLHVVLQSQLQWSSNNLELSKILDNCSVLFSKL